MSVPRSAAAANRSSSRATERQRAADGAAAPRGGPAGAVPKKRKDVDRTRIDLAYRKLAFLPPAVAQKYGSICRVLDLSHNKLVDFSSLDGFDVLHTLILDSNDLRSHTRLPILPALRTLWVNKNNITNLAVFIEQLSVSAPHLSYLSMLHNEACPNFFNGGSLKQYNDYRYFVISKLKHLTMLDTSPVTAEERAESKRLYGSLEQSELYSEKRKQQEQDRELEKTAEEKRRIEEARQRAKEERRRKALEEVRRKKERQRQRSALRKDDPSAVQRRPPSRRAAQADASTVKQSSTPAMDSPGQTRSKRLSSGASSHLVSDGRVPNDETRPHRQQSVQRSPRNAAEAPSTPPNRRNRLPPSPRSPTAENESPVTPQSAVRRQGFSYLGGGTPMQLPGMKKKSTTPGGSGTKRSQTPSTAAVVQAPPPPLPLEFTLPELASDGSDWTDSDDERGSQPPPPLLTHSSSGLPPPPPPAVAPLSGGVWDAKIVDDDSDDDWD